jgi:cytochrome c peroxidase
MNTAQLTLLLAGALLLSACERPSKPPKPVVSVTAKPGTLSPIASAAAARLDAPALPLSAMALLGRKIFHDTSLSASGKLSCASCHNPQHAYAPPNSLAVQLGGPQMNLQGGRAVPSLTYLERTPHFVIRPDTKFDPDDRGAVKAARPSVIGAQSAPDSGIVQVAQAVPEGGMDWDGRAATLPDQAGGPLFDPREMANRDGPALLAKLKAAPYASELVALFGAQVFDASASGLSSVYLALARYQAEDRSFHAYDSKFDYYLAGRTTLSQQELRGLTLFDDPKKGNCAACHLDKPSKNRLAPVFTDYEFEALAVPRNRQLAVNRDPAYFDEGLCGPSRKDMSTQQVYCGMFKTPTLRNVATRQVFFHNGVFHSLEDVVKFYVQRETQPEEWYPHRADGSVQLYDDLPPAHRANVDIADAPFNQHRGDQPALSDSEIKDVVAFLQTLTDGYRPVRQ